MNRQQVSALRRWVCSLLGIALLGGITLGCSEPPENTPEEKQKIQQEHKERANREMQDG